ncbi:MAG: T9SS type A sorting domain-containing protein [Bacteroidota bacterium]
MKRYLLITFLVLFSLKSSSQNWHNMLTQGETDFRKIQKAFYKEWKDKPIERGNGYKLFKRWENFMSTRLDRKGRITNRGSVYYVRQTLNEKNELAAKLIGDSLVWKPLGIKSWLNGNHGYNPGNGRINCVTVLPGEENDLYIGAPVGGIWRKDFQTNEWEILSEELVNVGVTDIYIDPEQNETIYILTGDAYGSHTESIGVMKSIDGGETWQHTGLEHGAYSGQNYYKLEVLPSNKNIMLVAGNSGIERSTDFGETWGNVLEGYTFSDLMVHPLHDSIIYASARDVPGTDAVFFKSSDWGESWQNLSFPSNISEMPGRTALAVSINEPDFVYMLAANTSGGFGGLYRSENAGESFRLISSSPNIVGSNPNNNGGQGSYDLALAINPENALEVYVGGFYVYKSADGGENFDRLNSWIYDDADLPYVHADIHTLDFYNGSLYSGNDGGIFVSRNNGTSWLDLSAGLDITQFYRIGLDPNNENIIVGGTQDNGSNLLINDQWYHIFGADGMEAIIDHTDPGTVYASFQFGRINKFGDYGTTFQGQISQSSGAGNGGWITPYQMDPSDNKTLYAGYADVWKTEDAGINWEEISDFKNSSLITDLQISQLDPNYIYVTNGNDLMVTKDGGDVWSSVSEGLPVEPITRIAISKNDSERVWITLGGLSEGEKVYYSETAGESWVNISEGLPNVPANCIVHQENSDNQLYVGTDIGVFERKNGDTEWKFFSTGLPSVIITELEIHKASAKLRAATFGRGIWEIKTIFSVAAPLTIRGFVTDLNTIQEGERVNFSADINGQADQYFWEFEGGIPETSTEEFPSILYIDPGEYDVTLTVRDDVQTKSFTQEKLVSVNKVLSTSDDQSFFNIYPIPADKDLMVKFEGVNRAFRYQLINLDGKSIVEETYEKPIGSFSIDISNLDNGIYYLKVESENQQYTRKVVVSR